MKKSREKNEIMLLTILVKDAIIVLNKKSYEGKSSLCGTAREGSVWWKLPMESEGEDRS